MNLDKMKKIDRYYQNNTMNVEKFQLFKKVVLDECINQDEWLKEKLKIKTSDSLFNINYFQNY